VLENVAFIFIANRKTQVRE